ncbi:MAG: methylmalonyl Co-A mutase-associated GTPase MeaB [Acidimicrobiia bacterium]
MDTSDLLQAALTGDVRSIGRVLTEIESRSDAGSHLFAELYAVGGSSWTSGITGTPGAGKSTLVASMIPMLSTPNERLAVVAVDPSSPFTGGAILGDRIRMGQPAQDANVYIRSVANRGSLGGIAETTPAIVSSLDGLGFAEIIVETVGVGQSEVEIATTADTTVVAVNPGWGDTVQTSKAGFLEIADIFVVNKADLDGAEQAVRDLELMLSLGPSAGWTPPVVATVATQGEGVEDVVDAIRRHREHLATTGELLVRRRDRAARELAAAIRQSIILAADADRDTDDLVQMIVDHQVDPWTAAGRALGAE